MHVLIDRPLSECQHSTPVALVRPANHAFGGEMHRMRGQLDIHGRIFRVSYRRATWVVCAGNLVVTLCVMYLILPPLYLRAASLPDRVKAVAPGGRRYVEQMHSKEDLERMKASNKLRRALMPFHLIQEVKELQAETEVEIQRTKRLSAARYKRSVEVSQRLAEVKQSNTQSNQHGLLLRWKKKKLQGARRYQNEGRHQSGFSKWNSRG